MSLSTPLDLRSIDEQNDMQLRCRGTRVRRSRVESGTAITTDTPEISPVEASSYKTNTAVCLTLFFPPLSSLPTATYTPFIPPTARTHIPLSTLQFSFRSFTRFSALNPYSSSNNASLCLFLPPRHPTCRLARRSV